MKPIWVFLVFISFGCSELTINELDNEAVNDDKYNDETPDASDDDEKNEKDEQEDEDESDSGNITCTPADLTENEQSAIDLIFEEADTVCIKEIAVGEYYEIYHEDELKGFAMTSSHQGFDGPVVMMTGFDKDGKILKVAEVSQYESWWFRVGSWFFDQFKDIEISKISLDPKYSNNCWPCDEMYDSFTPYSVDSVSGATYTSNAITKDIWDAIYIYDELPEIED